MEGVSNLRAHEHDSLRVLQELELPLVGAVIRIERCEIVSMNGGDACSEDLGSARFSVVVPLYGCARLSYGSVVTKLGRAMVFCPPSSSISIAALEDPVCFVRTRVSVDGEGAARYLELIRGKCREEPIRVEHQSLGLLHSLVAGNLAEKRRGIWESFLVEPALRIATVVALQKQLCESREAHSEKGPRAEEIVCAAEEYIEANFHDAEISLIEIASEVGVSSRHLTRVFKQRRGRTASQYLADLRLENARKLLVAKPNALVKEVAFECGFSSPSYFSACYKKRFAAFP